MTCSSLPPILSDSLVPLPLPLTYDTAREEWQFGAREDWRFTDMSAQLGRIWWLVSFFATYLSQHVMLVGITWPLLTVHTSPTPWHPVWDTLIIAAAVAGEKGGACMGRVASLPAVCGP